MSNSIAANISTDNNSDINLKLGNSLRHLKITLSQLKLNVGKID